MKDHLKHHVKHMVIGAAVVLVALIALGVNLGEALMWAVLLACPVGMIGMMWWMGRQHEDGGEADGHAHDHHGSASTVPEQRVTDQVRPPAAA